LKESTDNVANVILSFSSKPYELLKEDYFMNINLFRHVMVPVKMNVKQGERVLILSDYKMDLEIKEALITAVYFQEAIPVLLVIPPLEVFGNELPEIVEKAVLDCDLIIAVCSTSVSHTNAIRLGRKNGKRYYAMGGVTVESLTSGAATANYEQVYALSTKVAEIMTKGNNVKVLSEKGTNIEFSILGREGFPLAGIIDKNGISGFPDGEAALSPVEGSANGVIVVDGTVHHIGRLKNEIWLTVENGRVIKIEGGLEAEQLKEFLEKNGDDNSYNLAEFAIGTNSAVKSNTENTQDYKKMLGTIHFGIGDNITLGGHTYSKIHMDTVVRNCSVIVDNIEVLRNGKMVLGLR